VNRARAVTSEGTRPTSECTLMTPGDRRSTVVSHILAHVRHKPGCVPWMRHKTLHEIGACYADPRTKIARLKCCTKIAWLKCCTKSRLLKRWLGLLGLCRLCRLCRL